MVFREYLDESEDSEKKILSVGGFVGKDCVWGRLQTDWLAALPKNIEFFQATDCFSGNNQFEPGKGFDIPHRVRLLGRLTDLICDTDIHLVCHGIDVVAYKAHAPKKKINDFLINEYVAPFQAAVETGCRDYPPIPEGYPANMESGDSCSLFFEENRFPHTAVESIRLMRADQELWWRSRIGNVTHGTKGGPSAIPLLQVADLGVFLGAKVIGEAPDGTIPWTPYYEKLKKANRVFRRPGKISRKIINTLKGLHETLQREELEGKNYWDDLPLT